MEQLGKNTGKLNKKREERHDAILEIIKNGDINTQSRIIEELKNMGIHGVNQGTISKDLAQLKIEKNDKGFYSISNATLKKNHISKIKSLLEADKVNFFTNVSYYYLKTELGMASQYEFHLSKAFPEVILDVDIKKEGVLILIDMDNPKSKNLIELLD